jgi:WD40 repeat protein
MDTELQQLFESLRTDADALKLASPQAARRRGVRQRRRAYVTGAFVVVLILLCGTAYAQRVDSSPFATLPGSGAVGPTRTPANGGGGGVVLNDVVYSPDGKYLATADSDGSAQLWSADTHQPIRTFAGRGQQAAISVAFAPDGKTLAVSDSSGLVTLWDVATASSTDTLSQPGSGPVTDVAFSPDGRTIATASEDGPARLWNVETGSMDTALVAVNVRIISLAFSRDGKLLVTGGQQVDQPGGQPTVELWDVGTGRQTTAIAGFTHPVVSVAFSPDGGTVAAGDGDDNTVHTYSAATGLETAGFVATGASSVFGVAYSPDGTKLAAAYEDATARLWNSATGQPVTTFTGHTDTVEALAFSPDGRTLATASADGTLRFSSVPTR